MSALCCGDGPGAKMVEINRLLSAGNDDDISDEDLKRLPKYANDRRWGEFALRPEFAVACCLLAARRGLSEVPKRYLYVAAICGKLRAVDSICREAELRTALQLDSPFGVRLLEGAIVRNNAAMVQCLAALGASRHSTRLISLAIRKGSPETITAICTSNRVFNLSRKKYLREAESRGQPSIYAAVEGVKGVLHVDAEDHPKLTAEEITEVFSTLAWRVREG